MLRADLHSYPFPDINNNPGLYCKDTNSDLEVPNDIPEYNLEDLQNELRLLSDSPLDNAAASMEYSKLLGEASHVSSNLPAMKDVSLETYYTRNSSMSSLNNFTEVFEACLVVVQFIFSRALLPPYSRCPNFLEKLFCTIFCQCSTKREMLEGAQYLAMAFPNATAVANNKKLLQEWVHIENPLLIRPKAKQLCENDDYNNYQEKLMTTLRSIFQSDKKLRSNASAEKKYAICRLVLMTLLKKMDRHKTSTSSALASSTNIPTATERLLASENKCRSSLPSCVVEDQSKCLPFFNPEQMYVTTYSSLDTGTPDAGNNVTKSSRIPTVEVAGKSIVTQPKPSRNKLYLLIYDFLVLCICR